MPSYILTHGSSLDIQCAEIAIDYESYCNRKHADQKDGKISADLTQEQMQAMINRVRNKDK